MISKAASYTIVVFAAIMFIGGVFYVFVILDSGDQPKMSGAKILPQAAPIEIEPEEEPETPIVPPVPPTSPPPPVEPEEEPPVISPEPEPEPEPESGPKTYVVSIESGGFTPKLVTIKVGDTVKWVNNNSKLHWPASDPHPTHTGLPDFDPFADLLPGETFSYIFKEAGAFSYHDHTEAVIEDVATLTGVVRVLEE